MKRIGANSPTKRGGRTVTITLRATPEDAAKIDRYAEMNGLCRAAFLTKCANAGYRALRESGGIK